MCRAPVEHAVLGSRSRARLRKLLRGSPSASVSTLTRIRPSSASVIDRVVVDRVERLLLVLAASRQRRLRCRCASGRSAGWSAAPCRSRCFEATWVFWPSGENGAVTICSRDALVGDAGDVVDAEAAVPSATYRYSPRSCRQPTRPPCPGRCCRIARAGASRPRLRSNACRASSRSARGGSARRACW